MKVKPERLSELYTRLCEAYYNGEWEDVLNLGARMSFQHYSEDDYKIADLVEFARIEIMKT